MIPFQRIFGSGLVLVAVGAAVAGCGGGGSGGYAAASPGGAGIGGSGYQARGNVTGFGSIFVNGIELDTAGASFEIEGAAGSENDLFVGARVIVDGRTTSATRGVATRVRFDDELEGPIPAGAAITTDPDGETKDFSVLGVPVRVETDTTHFLAGASFAGLAAGQELSLSGFYDDAGVLHATAVVAKGGFTPGVTLVEAKGRVENPAAGGFDLRVGTRLLSVDSAGAVLTGFPAGVAAGQTVEVRGTIPNDISTAVTAVEVRFLDEAFGAGLPVELEGIVTRFASLSDFDVDGQRVDGSGAARLPANLSLRVGLRLEVEGSVSGGVVRAQRLVLREGRLKVHGTGGNANASAGTFEVTVAGQRVRVTVDGTTRLEDKTSGVPLTLSALDRVNGRFVRIRGHDDGSGAGILAARVVIDAADDEVLQGVLAAQSVGSSLTVLGVTVAVDATTEFQDPTNAPYPGGHADFAAQATVGSSLVKITDKQAGAGGANPPGTADEVELQLP
ncbi:MAG: hypothetical protein D6731_20165 [Planctomycetota bacterium]|nr:MAG: hypothetical protein D6731_20165 [Planctomycetota bacterium]